VDDIDQPQISDELPELSALPTQDIPEAVREGAQPLGQVAPARRKPLLWGIGGLGVAGLIAVPLVLALRSQAPPSPSNQATTSSFPSSAADQASSQAYTQNASILGHLPYQEAPASELEPISSDISIRMRKAAANKFREMVEAAAKDGVTLVPISAFRSVADQEKVFFDVKAERGEDTAQRAAVSAPPGYSEHHTGYAVDIGDGDHPGTNLQYDFEDTAAFKWLKQNAVYYSFEMSFPKGNPMGVSYEPWHWRFVGDRQSLETFYRARTILGKGSVTAPGTSGSNNSGSNSSGSNSSGSSTPDSSPEGSTDSANSFNSSSASESDNSTASKSTSPSGSSPAVGATQSPLKNSKLDLGQ
jgi:D-alanyl-D-alanine carboxypeptidase